MPETDKVLIAVLFFILGDYVGLQGAIDFGSKIIEHIQQVM